MENNVEIKIRSALSVILARNVEKINVSYLCSKAGVSRASFYIYYKDLDDLIIKTRHYIVNKLKDQLNIILETKDKAIFDCPEIIFSDEDISLLKGFMQKTHYWEFAVTANSVIIPEFRKKMIERHGEEYYNENKETFEFVICGGIATLYFDLVAYDKKTFAENLKRICKIADELFNK